MKLFSNLSFWLHRSSVALFDWSAQKLKTHFYLYLAGLFTLLIVVDAVSFQYASTMRQTAFDLMVRYRLVVPPPDKDIVIVDINEASLAAMSPEYGRWPWPRQVLAEFVEQIQQQQPQAIVFDILFSDPDVFNPDSDAYFDQVMAASNNTYFPMLRLDPSDDAKSALSPAQIPGVKPLPDAVPQPEVTVAMVMPHFQSVIAGGRLGLHNIYPDVDGIARSYTLYRDDYGWQLPSLPLRLGRELGFPEPAAAEMLLNWRGKPFSYQTVSFSDVYFDLSSQHKKRPQDEFKGKIVIIGSTAPSLFDIKPTPVSKAFPGVEILATAIDNTKNNDFLRVPDVRWLYTALTLLMIWATAWGFYRDAGRDRIDTLFGLSQFILMGISYASINLSTTYINLTGPVTFGLVYFTLARMYAIGTSSALEQSAVRTARNSSGELHGALLLVRLARQSDQRNSSLLNDSVREAIRLALEKQPGLPRSVEVLKGNQKGLWKLFDDMLVISWLLSENTETVQMQLQQDIQALTVQLPSLLTQHHLSPDRELAWFVHQGNIAGGEAACDSWRGLFAETLLRWQQTGKDQNEKASV